MITINKLLKSNSYFYLLLTLTVSTWQIFGIGKVNLRLSRGIDQEIMQLTSAKMFYFDFSSYQAAWNHHSPLLFYLTKFSYIFSDFYNSTFGFYALYTLFLCSVSITLYKILFELLKNKYFSFLGSLIFIFDISSSTIGGKIIFDNRTWGILFQSLIILSCIGYLKNKKIIYLYLLAAASIIQIYNLESYSASIFCVYLYLLYIEKDKLYFFLHSLSAGLITIFYFAFLNFLNKELSEFFSLNIMFHISSIGLTNKFNNFKLTELFKAFFLEGNSSLSFLISLGIIFFVSITFLFNFKKKYLNEIEKLIYILLLGEVLHLFLTGPRFTSYAQVLLLPIFIVIFFQIMTLFDRLNLNRHFGLIPFFIIFFVLQFGDVVHNRTSLIDGTLKETLESYNKPTEDPKLILTWVDIDKYEKVFFENNSLPSTRLWWWHQMKYVDDFYDKNYKMFDDELLETVFTEDVKKERPKIAIIDTSIVSPPDYFLDYIIEHYQFSRLDGDLIYYQLNN